MTTQGKARFGKKRAAGCYCETSLSCGACGKEATPTVRDWELARPRVSELYDRGTDSREPLLTREEVSELRGYAEDAMTDGAYQVSFMATEALLCQADRGGEAPLRPLPDPRDTACGRGRTPEMVQGFVDRVEGLNRHVARARARA